MCREKRGFRSTSAQEGLFSVVVPLSSILPVIAKQTLRLCYCTCGRLPTNFGIVFPSEYCCYVYRPMQETTMVGVRGAYFFSKLVEARWCTARSTARVLRTTCVSFSLNASRYGDVYKTIAIGTVRFTTRKLIRRSCESDG